MLQYQIANPTYVVDRQRQVFQKITKSEKQKSIIMTNLHLSLWRSTALQLRWRATRNLRSIDFAYWYVFLRTLYTAAALRLYTIHTDRITVITHRNFLILRYEYEACGAVIDWFRGNRWYSYAKVERIGLLLHPIPEMRLYTK
jgi:hypothetical protein